MKEDGSIEFSVDYCKVNEVSQFDAYPMAWADELLDQLRIACYKSYTKAFSTLYSLY